MSSQSPGPAIIIGAGKTGRGLAAVLCQRSGLPVVLVDHDQAIVNRLREAGTYDVHVLGSVPARSERIAPLGVFHLDDPAWRPLALTSRVLFTAVFGNHLGEIAGPLATLLAERVRVRAGPVDIITCENLTNAARILKTAVAAALPEAQRVHTLEGVGFVESMVLTTSLGPAAGANPLDVRTQDTFRLPCDGDAFIGDAPGIVGLEPLPRFSHQLMRKIFTYNGINAVISYLGAERGYHDLAQAAQDPGIAALAYQAGDEASAALVAEYGFAAQEQARWVEDAMAKFRDPAIPDPISRNAADPLRKLARDDRLVGPALLALRHGRSPLALARGIASAATYRDGDQASLLERHGTMAAVLAATAQLAADHPLVRLVGTASSGVAVAHG